MSAARTAIAAACVVTVLAACSAAFGFVSAATVFAVLAAACALTALRELVNREPRL